MRHVLERHRASNTGRLIPHCLQGGQLQEYATPERDFEEAGLAAPDTWLLYPRPGARQPTQAPRRLVVLDATWSQARKMGQRIRGLSSLPAVALPPPQVALPRLRKGREPEQMSTAESVIAALRLFGEDSAASHLEGVLREVASRFALPRRKAR